MSRVWKRFLLKIGKTSAVVVYILTAIFGGGYISLQTGNSFDAGMIVGAAVMIFLPVFIMGIMNLYFDAKREVEQENRDLLRKIKG
jgi:ABC-type dipeptide/oligopeptide/nickel transport system permease component